MSSYLALPAEWIPGRRQARTMFTQAAASLRQPTRRRHHQRAEMKSRGRQASNVPSAMRGSTALGIRVGAFVGCSAAARRLAVVDGRWAGGQSCHPVPRLAGGMRAAPASCAQRHAHHRPPSPNTPLLMPASTAPPSALIPLHAPSGGAALVAIVAIVAIVASILQYLPPLAEPPPGAYLAHAYSLCQP